MRAVLSTPPPSGTYLERLVPEGRRLVTPELVSGAQAAHSPSVLAPYLEMLDRRIELGPLRDALDAIVGGTERYDPEIDGRLAPAVHAALPLSRREASDAGIWRWLAIAYRPDVVRHRWENRYWLTMRSRFWAMGTRPDSNLFARAWWIAELTRGPGGDYELTTRVLRRQTLANALFVRSLSSCRHVVAASVDLLEGESADTIERTLLGLSRWAATVPLEGVEEADVRETIRGLMAG